MTSSSTPTSVRLLASQVRLFMQSMENMHNEIEELWGLVNLVTARLDETKSLKRRKKKGK